MAKHTSRAGCNRWDQFSACPDGRRLPELRSGRKVVSAKLFFSISEVRVTLRLI